MGAALGGQDHTGRRAADPAAVGYWAGVMPAGEAERAASYLRRFEPELLAQTRRCESLAEAAVHLIAAGGRRIRPLVVFAACEAAGGDWRAAVDHAVAVELVHTASLVHDDIVDRSGARRGLRAVHVEFGLRTALLCGDALCFVAFELAAEKPGIVQVLAATCREMCIGEAMAAGPAAAERKTAALFRAAAHIGAVVAGADESTAQALRCYGHLLGMAYQLRDDQLDGEGKADPSQHARRAQACLEGLAPGTARGLLHFLADYAARREE